MYKSDQTHVGSDKPDAANSDDLSDGANRNCSSNSEPDDAVPELTSSSGNQTGSSESSSICTTDDPSSQKGDNKKKGKGKGKGKRKKEKEEEKTQKKQKKKTLLKKTKPIRFLYFLLPFMSNGVRSKVGKIGIFKAKVIS